MSFHPQQSSSPLSRDPVLSWINGQALALTTIDPHASLEDLAPLEKVVGNTSLVGLGEASHGAHEFFVLKHRLLRFLVEKMGFTMFAMEADWTKSQLINDYVLTGQGDIRALLTGIGHRVWKTEEVLDLLEWMRAYNADPRHIQKVHFAGFDCILIHQASLEKIVQFFQEVDPEYCAQVAELYTDLDKLSWRSYPEPATLQLYVQAAEHVSSLLKDHQQEYSQRSSPETFAAILQEARIVEQVTQQIADGAHLELEDPKLGAVIQQRDLFMSENIAWLHEHAPAGEKMVLWAHNSHIGTWGGRRSESDDAFHPYIWMGMDLRKRYQQQYLSIGFSFLQGSLNAVPVAPDGKYLSSEWQPFAVQPASEGSYNERFAQGGSCYLLDLRSAPEGEVGTWLDGPHPFRHFDTDYCNDERRFYQSVSLPQWFDVLGHIHQVSPSQMLSPL